MFSGTLGKIVSDQAAWLVSSSPLDCAALLSPLPLWSSLPENLEIQCSIDEGWWLSNPNCVLAISEGYEDA